MKGIVSIWKAAARGRTKSYVKAGFKQAHFRGSAGQNPDGMAYFSADRRFAEKYARCYGAGVIEVQLTAENYEANFARFEEICLGTEEVQIVIPREMLRLLNNMTIRRIWHHG